MENSRPGIGVTGLQMLVVMGVALIILSRFVSPTPHLDEFYHVLAAQSLTEDGSLAVNEGGADYTRAKAYTYAVAACIRWLDDSWASARLPSVLAGALLVTVLFGWLDRVSGPRAAWIGAFLLMLAPDVIGFSSMVRFYMPHTLFVWLAAVCVYVFVTAELTIKSRLSVVILGLGCAAMATHLQTTTVIAALIITVWAGTEFAGWLVRCEREQFKWAMFWMLLVLVIAVPAVWFGLHSTGYLAHMQDKFQTPRLWSAAHKYQFQYYHRFFANSYPLLWAGFPFAAVIALATRRRPAWFCLVFFVLAFVIHSLMPFKATRYLAYAWPCFFVLWAIALDGLLIWLLSQGRLVIAQVFGEAFSAKKFVGVMLGICLFLGLLFAGWISPEYKVARKMLSGESLGPCDREDWASVADTLKPIAEETGFVVCSAPPKAVYYLGRLDVGLSVSQAGGRDEFEHHRVMGRPVVTTRESVQRLMDEHPKGLIVVETKHFGARNFVPGETALFIQSHTQPIELQAATGVKAFAWGLEEPLLSD